MLEQSDSLPQLFDTAGACQEYIKKDALSRSFADNKDASVHRWFRYSAGFCDLD